MTTTTTPETRPAPVEVVSPIKPSEAIRLGCLIAPVQCEGDWSRADNEACAAGAMNLGWGLPVADDGWINDNDTPDRWVDRVCPESGCDVASYSHLIPHVNDDHHWSRERIADWLESLGL